MAVDIGNITDNQTYLENGHYSTYDASKAFDKDTTTYWVSNTSGDSYIGIKSDIPYTIWKVRFLQTGGSSPPDGGKPKSFFISYSNDGTIWNDIEKFVVLQSSVDWQEFILTNPIYKAKYWRLHFTDGVYNSFNNPNVDEIEFHAYEPIITRYLIQNKTGTLSGLDATNIMNLGNQTISEELYLNNGFDDVTLLNNTYTKSKVYGTKDSDTETGQIFSVEIPSNAININSINLE